MRKGLDRRKKRPAPGLEWMPIPIVVVIVFAFAAFAVSAAVQPHRVRVVEYSVQALERVDPATGAVFVPVVQGHEGPAIQLGNAVPIRGTVTVHGDRQVIVTSSVVWEEVPLGRRVVIRSGISTALDPGVTRLSFSEPIPPEVSDAVNAGGAHLWRIVGTVTVDVSNAMGVEWSTASFWVVP